MYHCRGNGYGTGCCEPGFERLVDDVELEVTVQCHFRQCSCHGIQFHGVMGNDNVLHSVDLLVLKYVAGSSDQLRLGQRHALFFNEIGVADDVLDGGVLLLPAFDSQCAFDRGEVAGTVEHNMELLRLAWHNEAQRHVSASGYLQMNDVVLG